MNFLKELFGIHTEEFHPQTLVGRAFKETVKIVSASSTCFYKKNSRVVCTSGKQSVSCTTREDSSSYSAGKRACSIATGLNSSSYTEGEFAISGTTNLKGTSITHGKYSVAVSTSDLGTACCEEKHSVAVSIGACSKAKGVLGTILVLSEYDPTTHSIKNVEAVKVDGRIIKENTFYELRNGKFVECN